MFQDPVRLVLKSQTVNWETVQIESERLRLRTIRTTDAPEVFQHFTRELTEYMSPPVPNKVDDSLDFIEGSEQRMKNGEELQFVILDKRTGEFLGCCGIHGGNRGKLPELGVWVKAEAHGNHFGREAVFALKGWADDHVEAQALGFRVDKRNTPSIKIALALGGEIVEEVKVPTADGSRMLDEVVYSIPCGV